jgi:DNA-binding CsgD family transcriptional regulator
VRLIAQGFSTKEAAEYLDIAVRTAEKHRELAMKKIGARSAADLARYALRSGLTT